MFTAEPGAFAQNSAGHIASPADSDLLRRRRCLNMASEAESMAFVRSDDDLECRGDSA
jgi:hypothetical protein